MTLRYDHLAPSHKVKAVQILQKVLGDGESYTKTIQPGSLGQFAEG